MPIYEYECKSCKNTKQELFSVDKRSDAVLCDCGEIADRVISTGQFTVNGANAANNYSGDSNYWWSDRGKH